MHLTYLTVSSCVYSIDTCLPRRAGEIRDGGGDMFGWPPFGGNRVSTSLCPTQRIAPYGDNFALHQSPCFGPGGTFRMDQRRSMFVLVARNW
jgi:hypothetical protein|eukprot:COSAG01_NODE_1518_length_10043_cov_99.027951_14_plen_92_part_00